MEEGTEEQGPWEYSLDKWFPTATHALYTFLDRWLGLDTEKTLHVDAAYVVRWDGVLIKKDHIYLYAKVRKDVDWSNYDVSVHSKDEKRS